MPGIPLFTDNHVRQPLVEALRRHSWLVVRAVDVFPEGTDDETLFGYAATNNMVFVTNDQGVHRLAHLWLAAGRPFRMLYWRFDRHRGLNDGEIAHLLVALASKPGAFAYPIEYLKPGP